jgi:SulP family sulfate permease
MPRYLPKSVVCLREGLTRQQLLGDIFAGITVGMIALPLAMAFGIASIPDGVTNPAGISPPAMGLYTAVVAGFLISLLGGSRVQIGGPTGAFIVIIYGVAARHGYTGLATATVMAGIFVILMGLCRFGAIIKFIPYPVTTGFTAGIAVIIFSSQVKDFAGLHMGSVPAEFIDKWYAYFTSASTWSPAAVAIGTGTLLLMVALRRFAPRIPGAIVAVVVASLLTPLLHLQIDTIGSRFGGIPHTLPAPSFSAIDLKLARDLIPDALTIALLIAIESLLSAVVADGMTGGRHKADCELVAQGVANIASILFGGIPATGAIARTAANIKCGGRTPLAGMIHAITLLVIILVAAPLASAIPLSALAAVLIIVAWNMSEFDQFRSLFRAPPSDILVLLTTFGLTVFTDLRLAVGVGMVLASMLFMKRMADVSNISAITREFDDGDDELAELKDPNAISSRDVPPGVEVYEINGPFFFGVADRLKDILHNLERPPKVFILRMRRVPSIDATGMHSLDEFHDKCKRDGTLLLLSGVHAQPLFAFTRSGFIDVVGSENMFGNLDDALNRAREFLGLPPKSRPATALPEVAREQPSETARKNKSA